MGGSRTPWCRHSSQYSRSPTLGRINDHQPPWRPHPRAAASSRRVTTLRCRTSTEPDPRAGGVSTLPTRRGRLGIQTRPTSLVRSPTPPILLSSPATSYAPTSLLVHPQYRQRGGHTATPRSTVSGEARGPGEMVYPRDRLSVGRPASPRPGLESRPGGLDPRKLAPKCRLCTKGPCV